jgi:hypothetical protein
VASGDIEELLAKMLPGFQTVDIPGVGSTSLREDGKPPLKRQMSDLALAAQLPPPVTGDRRFFRTWVRAVQV